MKLYEEKINALRESLGLNIKIENIEKFLNKRGIIINWLEVK
jgi:hypothetical protein